MGAILAWSGPPLHTFSLKTKASSFIGKRRVYGGILAKDGRFFAAIASAGAHATSRGKRGLRWWGWRRASLSYGWAALQGVWHWSRTDPRTDPGTWARWLGA